MWRTTLTIDGQSHVLAQGTQIAALKTEAEDAVRVGGRFIDLTVVGNFAVSVLVTPGVAISLTTREVPDDPRDNGDILEPYDHLDVWDVADLL